ncbi:ABC transporter ATP-binding protein/permease [Patescibacteria group bacterium]|nr:ABC transporter ATP-binding protein/permease [Patescibacteria group bacterium]
MKPIREIFRYTSGLQKYMWAIAVLSVVTALLSFASPFIIKFATDWVAEIIAGKTSFDWNQLGVYALLLLASTIVQSVISDVSGYIGDQLSIRTRHQLSTAYYKHLLALPQHYYDNEISGKIINRLSRAITDVTSFLQFFSNNLLQMMLTTLLTLVVMAVYGWQLAVVMALLIPANLYLTARTSTKWQKLEKKKNSHFDVASGRFAEVIGQIRLVKSFIAEPREYKLFDREVKQMIGLTAEQSRYWHTMNFMRNVVFGALQSLSIVVIFYLAGHGKLTVGDIAMLIILIQQASMPLRGLSYFVDSYQRAIANSKDFLEAMNEPVEPRESGRKSLKVTKAEVEFRDATFSYTGKKSVLSDVSFIVKPGHKLALVGESGGGKTTISNLLMGLYPLDSGEILIDGQDIAKVKRHDVRQAIATVFQDPALFSGTIRENIAYARPDASDTDIMRAAKAANADEFIKNFEKGLGTEIGERGVKLSGGQKQRLAIARAVLKDAPILILDEATSSLDSRAEHEVQEALDRLMKGRTVLIIAHRLSTIAGVDTIVTLKDGRVDETGSPAQLAKTGGIYSQLLDLQMGATEAAKKKLAAFEIAG